MGGTRTHPYARIAVALAALLGLCRAAGAGQFAIGTTGYTITAPADFSAKPIPADSPGVWLKIGNAADDTYVQVNGGDPTANLDSLARGYEQMFKPHIRRWRQVRDARVNVCGVLAVYRQYTGEAQGLNVQAHALSFVKGDARMVVHGMTTGQDTRPLESILMSLSPAAAPPARAPGAGAGRAPAAAPLGADLADPIPIGRYSYQFRPPKGWTVKKGTQGAIWDVASPDETLRLSVQVQDITESKMPPAQQAFVGLADRFREGYGRELHLVEDQPGDRNGMPALFRRYEDRTRQVVLDILLDFYKVPDAIIWFVGIAPRSAPHQAYKTLLAAMKSVAPGTPDGRPDWLPPDTAAPPRPAPEPAAGTGPAAGPKTRASGPLELGDSGYVFTPPVGWTLEPNADGTGFSLESPNTHASLNAQVRTADTFNDEIRNADPAARLQKFASKFEEGLAREGLRGKRIEDVGAEMNGMPTLFHRYEAEVQPGVLVDMLGVFFAPADAAVMFTASIPREFQDAYYDAVIESMKSLHRVERPKRQAGRMGAWGTSARPPPPKRTAPAEPEQRAKPPAEPPPPAPEPKVEPAAKPPSPPAPQSVGGTGYATHRDSALGIQFPVPAQWQAEQLSGAQKGVSWSGAAGTDEWEATINLYVMARSLPGYKDLNAAVATIHDEMKTNPDAKLLREYASRMGGMRGWVLEIKEQAAGENAYHYQHILVERPDAIGWLSFVAPDRLWPKMEPHLNQVLQKLGPTGN
ncbi:MAG: hypothetical protein JXR37_01560 [Kiritimatiellae bacterium]|nr:hypothetical protein [Kiritimatiellia bacterium]